MRLVVLGCGYSATRFVELHGGGFEQIAATARDPDRLRLAGLSGLAFGGTALSPDLADRLGDATHLIVSVPPREGGDLVLPLLAGLAAPSLRWIAYLSTVGVYGDSGGDWIDETAALRAVEPRNVQRIDAESGWRVFAEERAVPLQIFRLAGIYGPRRNALRTLRAGEARRIVKPGQVFNRIHVDDIAGALAAGLVRPDISGAVNVTDDEPAPPQDVVAYAAGLLGVAPPPDLPFETADLTPMARTFYSANKRVSNRRLREVFGYRLAYPTYREGLAALLPVEA